MAGNLTLALLLALPPVSWSATRTCVTGAPAFAKDDVAQIAALKAEIDAKISLTDLSDSALNARLRELQGDDES